MIRVLFLLIILSINFGCKRNKIKHSTNTEIQEVQNTIPDTASVKYKNSYKFEYVNSDSHSFGIEFFKSDLPVGPQDILLCDSSLYMLDQYYNNLKEINFDGQIINSSIPLSIQNIWLKQLARLNDKIIVVSRLDSIYIYTTKLELLERKYLFKGNGRIFSTSKDKVVLYYPMNHDFIEVNEHGIITKKVTGIKHKKDYKQKIQYFENSIKVNNRIYPIDANKLRNCIFDIYNDKMAYFKEDTSHLSLEIIHYK